MNDSSIIAARLSLLEYKLSEVLARLQKCESTPPLKLEAGVVSIEEAPIKNAAISAASDVCIAANRETIDDLQNAIVKNAIGTPPKPVDETPLRIYAMTFFNGKLTLSTNDREDFWLEIDKAVSWIKFEKLSNYVFLSSGSVTFWSIKSLITARESSCNLTVTIFSEADRLPSSLSKLIASFVALIRFNAGCFPESNSTIPPVIKFSSHK